MHEDCEIERDELRGEISLLTQAKDDIARLYALEGRKNIVLTEELSALRIAVDNLRRASVSLGQGAENDLRKVDSLEAKLEQSEHNCDMLLRYIGQALRDAKQLLKSLCEVSVQDADPDLHRYQTARTQQIIKGLERCLPTNNERV